MSVDSVPHGAQSAKRLAVSPLNLSKMSLLAAGIRAGYAFEIILPAPHNVFRAMRGDVGFIFQHWPGFLTRSRRSDFARLVDKSQQKDALAAAGLPAPILYQVVRDVAELHLDGIRFPAVVKPLTSSQSCDVTTAIDDVGSVRAAASAAIAHTGACLIEAHVTGRHYRLLVVGGTLSACVERRPPSVTGDGRLTVRALIAARNTEPDRGATGDRLTLLHRIVPDETTEAVLAAQDVSFDSVPSAGVCIRLHDRITGAVGAEFVDATRLVSQETVLRCEAFAKSHDLFIVGFDFITPDIRRSCAEIGAFNEINVRDVNTSCCEYCRGERAQVSACMWERTPFEDAAAPWFPLF